MQYFMQTSNLCTCHCLTPSSKVYALVPQMFASKPHIYQDLLFLTVIEISLKAFENKHTTHSHVDILRQELISTTYCYSGLQDTCLFQQLAKAFWSRFSKILRLIFPIENQHPKVYAFLASLNVLKQLDYFVQIRKVK